VYTQPTVSGLIAGEEQPAVMAERPTTNLSHVTKLHALEGVLYSAGTMHGHWNRRRHMSEALLL